MQMRSPPKVRRWTFGGERWAKPRAGGLLRLVLGDDRDEPTILVDRRVAKRGHLVAGLRQGFRGALHPREGVRRPHERVDGGAELGVGRPLILHDVLERVATEAAAAE